MKNYALLRTPVYVILIICVLLVAFLRISGDTGISHAMIILTSGYEEESLFAIWKFVNGYDAYTDPHNIPYAASYFNWFFYYFYGSIVYVLQAITGFSDDWIPQAGRYISLCGSLWALFISFKIVKLITGRNGLSLFAISVLISYFLGYFTGFWLFTVRPDAWAMALVVTGFWLFVRYMKSGNMAVLVLSAVIFYLAWGFKHSHISVAVGCFIVLLLRKRVAHAIAFAVIPVVLVLITFLFASDAYRFLILESQVGQGLLLHTGTHNLKLAIIKSLNISMTAIAFTLFLLIVYKPRKTLQKLWADDMALTLAVTGLVSFAFFALVAMKAGSSDNYFFTPFSIWAYIVIFTIYRLNYPVYKKWLYSIYGLFSLAYVGLGVLIISGKQGALNHKEMSERYYSIKDVILQNRQPLFVENDNNANLPWINPAERNFVIATTYYLLKQHPEKLEQGGLDSLMHKGYFNTIINVDNVISHNKQGYYIADTVEQQHATLYVWKKR